MNDQDELAKLDKRIITYQLEELKRLRWENEVLRSRIDILEEQLENTKYLRKRNEV